MIKCSKCGVVSSNDAPDCPRCKDLKSKTIRINTNNPAKTLDLGTSVEVDNYTERVTPQQSSSPTRSHGAPMAPPSFSPGTKFCTACGSIMHPSSKVPGSVSSELILLFLSFGSCIVGLLIPLIFILAICLFLGFIGYGIWRLTNRRDVCTQCGEGQLIPATSPVAMQMMSKIQQDLFGNNPSDKR